MSADAHEELDVAIVGGGPAGYSAALRCAERGLATALIERGSIGGTCLNVGCIPSKAVIHAAETFHRVDHATDMGVTVGDRRLDLAQTMRWKDGIVERLRSGVEGLLARGRVEVIAADAELVDARTIRTVAGDDVGTVTARAIVLATGSRPVELSHVPFGGRILSSTDALALTEVPETLVVVGAGYIGLELGTAMAKLGARVTFVEQAGAILPLFDPALVRPVRRRIEELGCEIRTSTTAVGVTDEAVVVEGPDGSRDSLAASAVLITVGRRAVTDGLGLERAGVELDGSVVRIDDRCRTSAAGVYAIGDLTGEPMLAHRGIAQGELVADVIAGDDVTWDHLAIPAVCFTDPEIFSVGLSKQAAGALPDGPAVCVGRSPFKANGRALTLHDEAGFVEVVADARNGVLLGVQAVGAGVAELSSSASLAIEMAATLEDLAATVIAHPTVSEALHDAVAAARR